jgi:predicted amidohydrolase YtcJ
MTRVETPGERAGTVRIITARRIISMGDGDRRTGRNALACRGEWIVAAGSLAELREEFPAAEILDFGDGTMVPGFNDAHQHPTISAEQSLQVPLTPQDVTSTDEVVAALRERAASTAPGEWIIGYGYDHFRSNAGVELTRDDLDAVSAEHPVLVVHVTLHGGVVNTRGLAAAGLTDDSEPPSGGELGRDAAGRLNGVLHDQALYDLAFPAFTRKQTVIGQPSLTDRIDALDAYIRGLHAAGITSAGDALVGPDGWDLLNTANEQGRLTLRVNALGAYEHFRHFR